MPSTSSQNADFRARVERLDRLSRTLDTRFRIPGIGIPIGWDSILGLIPGVGDVITAGPAAVMMYEAYRMNAKKRTLARMAWNTGVDLTVGAVPLVGDVFDVLFKAHRKNAEILKRELQRIEAESPPAKAEVNGPGVSRTAD